MKDDFELVERALGVLLDEDEGVGALSELARRVGCSRFVLHKAFRRSAGLTPKQCQAVLAVGRAGQRLWRAEPVLESALAVGLSGPGRLHDQFVRVEAIRPGEWKRGGCGVVFFHGRGATPPGSAEIIWTTRGIHRLGFVDGAESPVVQLQREWTEARFTADTDGARRLLRRIFAGQSGETFTVAAVGTTFQIAVWCALLTIPPGATTTYARLAEWVKRPQAARAVGQAVGANPVAVLIPCHRVIQASGALGGYHWGTERKWCLLARESGRGGRI